jgi:hypothetical protein
LRGQYLATVEGQRQIILRIGISDGIRGKTIAGKQNSGDAGVWNVEVDRFIERVEIITRAGGRQKQGEIARLRGRPKGGAAGASDIGTDKVNGNRPVVTACSG